MALLVATHNGRFHADEVMACMVLGKVFEIKILRSRDEQILANCDILVDVGGKYKPNSGKFDHHQAGCNATFDYSLIPLSSAGMVYKKYGKELIQKYMQNLKPKSLKAETLGPPLHGKKSAPAGASGAPPTKKSLGRIYQLLYKTLFREIDAIDNGVRQFPETKDRPAYPISNNYSSLVGSMNSADVHDKKSQMRQFKAAIKMARMFFDIKLAAAVDEIMNFDRECGLIKIDFKASLKEKELKSFICTQTYRYFDRCKKEICSDVDTKWVKFHIYPYRKQWKIDAISDVKLLSYGAYIKKSLTPVTVHSKRMFGIAKTLKSAKQMVRYAV
jgi:uncharacterized UPF0160 family protein